MSGDGDGADSAVGDAAVEPRAQAHAEQADRYLVEDDVLVTARGHAAAGGVAAVSPACGATLRLLAAAVRARSVVEVGTGAGVSGVWLLRGMADDGVLTSIDVDPELQRSARASFADAGHGPSRVRLINGMGIEVLPRLTDGGYDLVFVDTARSAGGARVDTEAAEYPRYLDEAVRLLRPGGILVLGRVLGAVGATTETVEAAAQVREDERLVPALLPLGDGLLIAVKTV